MPKTITPLSDVQVRKARNRDKAYNLYDGGGLILFIPATGRKAWRWKYRYQGKERRLSLGTCPPVTLAMARERRDRARLLLEHGADPAATRKAERAAGQGGDTFEAVAREWFAKEAPGLSAGHVANVLAGLEKDTFPWIGGRPVREVMPSEVLSLARRIEARGAIETAHRVVGTCGRIFRYAVGTGRADSDPTRDLRGTLKPIPRKHHFPAVTDPASLGRLLRTIWDYPGGLVVRSALRLAPMVFVRPGELRTAEWAGIDLEAGEWRFVASKTDTPHVVPLARQAVEVLRELQALTGRGRFVFPSGRSALRPMSNAAVLAALRTLGISGEEMTGHGFRATARTLLDEVLGFRLDLIEAQLAHSVADALGRAYNRTTFLSERREMMQAWADYLDGLRAGEVPQRKRGFA